MRELLKFVQRIWQERHLESPNFHGDQPVILKIQSYKKMRLQAAL